MKKVSQKNDHQTTQSKMQLHSKLSSYRFIKQASICHKYFKAFNQRAHLTELNIISYPVSRFE